MCVDLEFPGILKGKVGLEEKEKEVGGKERRGEQGSEGWGRGEGKTGREGEHSSPAVMLLSSGLAFPYI